jgi:putative nucleotidyltransferase-like protein
MIPASVEKLIEAYANVASANRAIFTKLRIVLSQFREHGIDSILLKGSDILPRLYGVMGLRAMVDVDLLVHEEDLQAIDHLLTHLGYRPLIDGNPAYVDPDNTLALDIITKVWYVDNQEEIWQRAVRRDFEGIPIKGMGGSDLLIYLTAYAVVHRGCLAKPFGRDIALVVEKEDVDWGFVVAEASRCHLKIPMYHGLSFVVTTYDGVPIPDYVLRSFAPATLSERLWYWFFEKLVTDQPIANLGHLLLFLTQPGLKKLRWLRNAFFPSPAFLKYRYGDKWNARPLATRLYRPFSLLFQATRLFIRIARLLITGRV